MELSRHRHTQLRPEVTNFALGTSAEQRRQARSGGSTIIQNRVERISRSLRTRPLESVRAHHSAQYFTNLGRNFWRRIPRRAIIVTNPLLQHFDGDITLPRIEKWMPAREQQEQNHANRKDI